MARRVKLAAGGLNIRLHPHSPELYAAFFGTIYDLRQPISLRGDRYGMITMLDRRDAEAGVIRGVIRTFTKIDPNSKWFDEANLADATPDLLEEIKIPPNAHPNSSSFRFSFSLTKHILTFEQYSLGKQLTPKSAYTLFRGLADNLAIAPLFGSVKISILQDKTTLDRIFKLTRLKSVTFVIDRPNPDIWDDDLEGKVDAHLAAVHAQQISVTYTAPVGDSLVETPALRQLGNGALRNGEIIARGFEGRAHVTVSTLSTPKIEQTTYDPETEHEAAVFERLRAELESYQ